MKNILFTILDWTWCLPQNLIGLIVKLITKPYSYLFASKFRNFYVYNWKVRSGSLSLGKYIFLSPNHHFEYKVIRHEYGHTLQNYILGPLYLLVIGLPSLLWAAFGYELTNKFKQVKYDSFYTERWANYLADKVLTAKNLK